VYQGTGPLGAPRERASRHPRTGSRDHRPRPPQSPPPQKKNIHQVNFIYRDSPHGEVLEPQPPSPQKKYMLHTTAPWFRSVRAVLGGNLILILRCSRRISKDPPLGFVGSHAQRGVFGGRCVLMGRLLHSWRVRFFSQRDFVSFYMTRRGELKQRIRRTAVLWSRCGATME
jgi:hypothetical protein